MKSFRSKNGKMTRNWDKNKEKSKNSKKTKVKTNSKDIFSDTNNLSKTYNTWGLLSYTHRSR